jgi:malate dehydrogenase (oxaloacetate-decarboxylating)
MLAAAAHALAGLSDQSAPGAPLLPPVANLRETSAVVGAAVARAAQAEGLADRALDDPDRQVREAMWAPAYPKVEAI